MKKVWQFITTPFRAAAAFVDDRPPISRVRRHLDQLQPVIRRNGPATEVHLQLIGASGAETECLKSLEAGGGVALARGLPDGVGEGGGLCAKRGGRLKGSPIARPAKQALARRKTQPPTVAGQPA